MHAVRVSVRKYSLNTARKACTTCVEMSRPHEWIIWRLIYRRFSKANLNDRGYPGSSRTFWADHVEAGIKKGLEVHKGNLSYAMAWVHGYDTTTERFKLGGLAAELACASQVSANLFEPLLTISSHIKGKFGSTERGLQRYLGLWFYAAMGG